MIPNAKLSFIHRNLYKRHQKLVSRLLKKIKKGATLSFQQLKLLLRYIKQLRKSTFPIEKSVAVIALALSLSSIPDLEAQERLFSIRTGANNPLDGISLGGKSTTVLIDFDGDNDLDLFSGSQNSGIFYYKNEGSTTTPNFVEQAGLNNPFSTIIFNNNAVPTFGDIDNDGDIDAVVGDNTGTMRFFRNDGSISIPNLVEQSGMVNPLDGINVSRDAKPVLVDIDNDGDLDIFIGNHQSLFYYKNQGTASSPSFVEQTGNNHPFSGLITYESGVAFADLDEDGDLDAFTTAAYYGVFTHYYKNTGTINSPAFTKQSSIQNPLNAVGNQHDAYFNLHPSFGDLDGDGDLDCVIGEHSGRAMFWENTEAQIGDIVFKQIAPEDNAFQTINDSIEADHYIRQAFADLDADGDYDLVLASYASDYYATTKIDYYKNEGTDEIPDFVAQNPGNNPFGNLFSGNFYYFDLSPVFVDIDNDSDMDLFMGNSMGTILFIKNTGTSNSPSFELQTANNNPLETIDLGKNSTLTFVDIDNDTDFDVFTGNANGDIRYFENNGNSSLPSFIEINGSNNPFDGIDIGTNAAPTLADIDNDGDLDAIIGRFENTAIHYFENIGTPNTPQFIELSLDNSFFNTFTNFYNEDLEMPDFSFFPQFIDIDNDGDLDGVVSATTGVDNRELLFWKNNSEIYQGAKVGLKVFLAGAFDLSTNMMYDSLRTKGLLPLIQPYSSLPGFNHTGGEQITDSLGVLGVIGADAIVDWVLLELRDEDMPTRVSSSRAALLQRDGDIVETDGYTPVLFDKIGGYYFVVIRHRNHADIMTKGSCLLSGITSPIDMSSPNSTNGMNTFGVNAQDRITPAIYGLWPGDVNKDGKLSFEGGNNDKDAIITSIILAPGNTSFASNYILEGYFSTDINMDGLTKYQGSQSDKDILASSIITHPSNISFATNFIFVVQLP